MLIAETIDEIRSSLKGTSKKIAFVPTMGALHEGHLSLINQAAKLAEIVVVSIFVNKTQFNDPNDYKKYPRQIEQDLEKLKNSAATHIFIPEEEEIFPKNPSFKILPIDFTNCLCGSSRPGHFDGVALIVSKLFNIVKPNIAFFGEKDFQQLLLIKKMVCDLNFDVEIYAGEIVREESGLAMSSRNKNLSAEEKIKAAILFKTLVEIRDEVRNLENNDDKNIEKILQKKRQELLEKGFEKIDYLEIRSEENLHLVTEFNKEISARIFVAAYISNVRLIDNLSL